MAILIHLSPNLRGLAGPHLFATSLGLKGKTHKKIAKRAELCLRAGTLSLTKGLIKLGEARRIAQIIAKNPEDIFTSEGTAADTKSLMAWRIAGKTNYPLFSAEQPKRTRKALTEQSSIPTRVLIERLKTPEIFLPGITNIHYATSATDENEYFTAPLIELVKAAAAQIAARETISPEGFYFSFRRVFEELMLDSPEHPPKEVIPLMTTAITPHVFARGVTRINDQQFTMLNSMPEIYFDFRVSMLVGRNNI